MPEIIFPETANMASLKAARSFDVKPILALLTSDLTADVSAMEKLISKNTICLVGSVSNYPFGTNDPIA